VPRRKKAEPLRAPLAHFVDTNVILRFLMGDDAAKAARATALMERVEGGEEVIEISDEVITETVWTLESFYKVPRTELAQSLTAIIGLPGVRISKREIVLEAIENYARTNADFVDCFLAARSKSHQIPIYSFDETDFRKLDVDWEKP
jgi:uncharacterized protein